MDEFDSALLEARGRVMDACRRDPVEAWRRWRRTRSKAMLRPPRDWCLKLRANDTRITAAPVIVEPEGALHRFEEHQVTICGPELRRLCAPVELPWPGLVLAEAARKLGRKPAALNRWLGMKVGRRGAQRGQAVSPHPNPLARGEGIDRSGTRRGVDGIERELRRWEEYRVAGSPLCVRYEKATPHGHFGRDVPVVWSVRPLDPGASRGEWPDPLFGTAWLKMHQKLSDEAMLVARRSPRFGSRLGGARQFEGWVWVCPGRMSATGQWMECGRQAKTLYAPQPIWTIEHFLGQGVELDLECGISMPLSKAATSRRTPKLVGTWRPGVDDPLAGRRGFACARCWGVRSLGLVPVQRHNAAVTYLSGGLLYGHEVERPSGMLRKRKNRPFKRRPKRVESKDEKVGSAIARFG